MMTDNFTDHLTLAYFSNRFQLNTTHLLQIYFWDICMYEYVAIQTFLLNIVFKKTHNNPASNVI